MAIAHLQGDALAPGAPLPALIQESFPDPVGHLGAAAYHQVE